MREDYEREGFSPIRFGIIGALVIAAVVAGILGYRSYQATKLQHSATVQELEQSRAETAQLKKDLSDLQLESQVASDKWKKQLQLRESQLSGLKREKDSESRSASSQLADAKKESETLQNQVQQAKKEMDLKTADLKKAQEQMIKTQLDMQRARADADRNAKSYAVLKAKLDKIAEGDQVAADRMVQELAEAKQQLKREQSVRKKLEEELEALRQQMQPPSQ